VTADLFWGSRSGEPASFEFQAAWNADQKTAGLSSRGSDRSWEKGVFALSERQTVTAEFALGMSVTKR
jgi:hypothetical protein